MTFKDFNQMLYTTVGNPDTHKVILFEDRESADDYIDYKLNGADSFNGAEILCTHYSDYKPEIYLKDEIVNSEVKYIMAIGRDTFVIVVDIGRK